MTFLHAALEGFYSFPSQKVSVDSKRHPFTGNLNFICQIQPHPPRSSAQEGLLVTM